MGAVEVKVIVWDPWATMTAWVFCGAGFQLVFPAWLASRVQVPTPVKLTTPPAMEQFEVEAGSIEKLTG